jgi:hypothetical protein
MAAAKATGTFSVYWNYQVWHLAGGEVVDGGLADYLLATGSPVEEISTGPAVDIDGDGVPDGTREQVLEWVDGDRVRAQAARDAEVAKGDKARSTLLAALDQLLAESGN